MHYGTMRTQPTQIYKSNCLAYIFAILFHLKVVCKQIDKHNVCMVNKNMFLGGIIFEIGLQMLLLQNQSLPLQE